MRCCPTSTARTTNGDKWPEMPIGVLERDRLDRVPSAADPKVPDPQDHAHAGDGRGHAVGRHDPRHLVRDGRLSQDPDRERAHARGRCRHRLAQCGLRLLRRADGRPGSRPDDRRGHAQHRDLRAHPAPRRPHRACLDQGCGPQQLQRRHGLRRHPLVEAHRRAHPQGSRRRRPASAGREPGPDGARLQQRAAHDAGESRHGHR